jgi:PIN domain
MLSRRPVLGLALLTSRQFWISACGRHAGDASVFRSFMNFAQKYVRRPRPSASKPALKPECFWRRVAMDSVLTEHAWKLQDRYQLSFWDALIVAAAKSAAATFLLTEDLQSGQDFGSLLVVNPFTTDPKSLL